MALNRVQRLICCNSKECVTGGDLSRGAPPEIHVVRAMRSLQHVPHEAARADVPGARNDHDVRTAARRHHHIVCLHPGRDLPPIPTLSGRYAISHAALFPSFIYLCTYCLFLYFLFCCIYLFFAPFSLLFITFSTLLFCLCLNVILLRFPFRSKNSLFIVYFVISSFIYSLLLSFLPLNNYSFQPYILLLIYTFTTPIISFNSYSFLSFLPLLFVLPIYATFVFVPFFFIIPSFMFSLVFYLLCF